MAENQQEMVALYKTACTIKCKIVYNKSADTMARKRLGLLLSLIMVIALITGCVLQADYTAKMADNMVMPNALVSFHRNMTGAELKVILRSFVEGVEGGFTPFNRGSLPVVSGVSIEVRENRGTYTLTKVL